MMKVVRSHGGAADHSHVDAEGRAVGENNVSQFNIINIRVDNSLFAHVKGHLAIVHIQILE